ncbi:hypothetical protein MNBD_GAMMA12-2967 [hydrothermal vent metagenome]|uniref:Uncharacterized protein n=1 Tax=hydrothermal vent metagenome TaxID=652676 RepID=A0A3B0YSV1_9ZZZZ
MLKINNNSIKFHHNNETHIETILKFAALVLIVLVYFFYMSWKYGASTGFGVSILTWSFFVLCTPISDGGFILAFPIRLLFKVRMVITQIVLWFVAVGINIVFLLSSPKTYELTFITRLLNHILIEPYPYWSILIISALGTFLSIFFGDEMMDVASHKERETNHRHGAKYRAISVFGLGVLTVVAYYFLLNSLRVVLPA